MNSESHRSTIQINKPRCPFCHDDIRGHEEKTGCNQCMAWFHTECWKEHGACTNCGVHSQRSESAASPPRRIPVPQVTESFVPLTPVEEKPSIYSAEARYYLTDEHRRHARRTGVKGGVKGVFVSLIPAVPIMAFCILCFTQEEYLSMFLFLGPIYVIVVFLFLYSVTKQNELKNALRNAPRRDIVFETPKERRSKEEKKNRNRRKRRRKRK
ncbi:MAG: hypothetical protein P1V97_21610 [Planctomycetota bacterium]|nr:hypothetical protein [Planctomycetota bacterium]